MSGRNASRLYQNKSAKVVGEIRKIIYVVWPVYLMCQISTCSKSSKVCLSVLLAQHVGPVSLDTGQVWYK